MVGRESGRASLRTGTSHAEGERKPIGGFLNTDVDAVLEFLDAFNKGTHGLRPDFTLEALLDMKTRMEGLLRLLLVVHACRW
jgi:hypothetical protein